MSIIAKSSSLKYIFIVIAAFSVHYFTHNFKKSPIVRISTGNVQGVVATSRNGMPFYLYLGIPFAEPPVGKLRFESPQPAQSWNGTLDASRYKPMCKGFDFFFLSRIQGQESCLFLNVYTPKVLPGQSEKLLPVIVHIHGGGFHVGGAEMYDGKNFMDHDVVLVTIQYRLGIFGFLSTKDEIVRGNMGLKDQVLALKWVQKNIINFGGDPNKVTIMGDSAGGSSVHLLMLSPMAKDLFHRAVTMGVAGTSGLSQFDGDKSGLQAEIAKHFKCPISSQQFVECLRGINDDELASYHSKFMSPNIYNNTGTIAVSIEKIDDPDAFLTENPSEILRKGKIVNNVPWIVGVNENEGLILLGMLLRFMDVHDIIDDKNWEKVLPDLLIYDKTQRPDVAQKVKEYVFGNDQLLRLNETEVTRKLSSMISELIFFKPIVESAKVHANSTPVYMYFYTYQGVFTTYNFHRWGSPNSVLPGELIQGWKTVQDLFERYVLGKKYEYGASHADDIFLIFSMISEPVVNHFDLEMSKLLVKTYVDFATFEKPTFQGLEWPAINSSGPLQCMELHSGNPNMLNDPFQERLKFWQELNLSHA